MDNTQTNPPQSDSQSSTDLENSERRDFLKYTTVLLGVAGTGMALWPFINSLNPAADILALLSVEVDISSLAVGQSITVVWRGFPLFIRRRTPAEIEAAQNIDIATLVDPQEDSSRVLKGKEDWLIVLGKCTHLGCVPRGQNLGDARGDWGGWYCPCHGSHYDTSGRIRKGPAPKNLIVPEYIFLSETTLRIG